MPGESCSFASRNPGLARDKTMALSVDQNHRSTSDWPAPPR
jgi:hypothetical protein